MPAPQIGGRLPRADHVYVVDDKWEYVLSNRGHGREWRRVFRVEPSQSTALWAAFAELAASSLVTDVRPTAVGIRCEMHAELTFNGRTAMVMLGWWYDQDGDAPRLVTAYPTP